MCDPAPLAPTAPDELVSFVAGGGVVVLTGAGISTESGLPTFRGSGGLWETYSFEEIACVEALEENPAAVLRFYNERRQAMRKAAPNPAHYALARLESAYRVSIITQNVDDLHERGGSSDILHLHGELRFAKSMRDPHYRIDLGDRDLQLGDTCPTGGQLRPDVVLFGEAVPNMTAAIELCQSADYLIVIGTSLQVYPAAGLLDCIDSDCPCILIDPSADQVAKGRKIHAIPEPASTAAPKLVDQLLQQGNT